MNEKTPGFCFSGFLIMMLMPSCMNGLLKSITRSRVDVIVIGAMAMSAAFHLHRQPVIYLFTYLLYNRAHDANKRTDQVADKMIKN